MKSPKTLQVIDILQAKDLRELKQKVQQQTNIIETAYRRLRNDVAKLREDMTGYHP